MTALQKNLIAQFRSELWDFYKDDSCDDIEWTIRTLKEQTKCQDMSWNKAWVLYEDIFSFVATLLDECEIDMEEELLFILKKKFSLGLEAAAEHIEMIKDLNGSL